LSLAGSALRLAITGQWRHISGFGFSCYASSNRKYDEEALQPLAAHLHVQFSSDETGNMRITLEGENVTHTIRTQEVADIASKIASLPRVREALLRRQRAFAEEPGLVADGRDMGTVVFPQADVKIFLTATAEERARRRYLELKEKGFDVNIDDLLSEIQARDERDMNRATAPLKPAADAYMLDSTNKTIEQVLEEVLNYTGMKLPAVV